MSKATVSVKVVWDPVQAVNEFDLYDIEICENHDPEKIELYMKDQLGNRIEGGTFDRKAFIDHVLAFYNKNF